MKHLSQGVYSIMIKEPHWRLWAKALGEKSGSTNQEADVIALIRTVIVSVNFITCLFIIAGIVRHWD